MNNQSGSYSTNLTRVQGIHRGKVTEIEDTSRGIISINLPHLFGEDDVRAEPCVPFWGKERGLLTLPEVNMGVWVMFNRGFLSQPVWLGGFWADGDVKNGEYDPDVMVLRTPTTRLEMDAKGNSLTLEIVDGASLTIENGDITLKGNQITLDVNGSKAVFNGAGFDVKNGNLKVI